MKYKLSIAVVSIVALTALLITGRESADQSASEASQLVSISVAESQAERSAEGVAMPASAAPAPEAPAVARADKVKNYIESLGAVTFSGAGLPTSDAPMPQHISLVLEDGSQLGFELMAKDVRGSENITWTGEVSGQPGSMVVLTRLADVVDGYINTLDRGELQVVGTLGADLKLERMHLEKGFCATCAAEHTTDEVPAGFQSLEQSAMTLLEEQGFETASVEAGANPFVDMLVVYTPRARASLGGVHAMNAKIITSISAINNVLALSDVALTIRLIHVHELDYLPGSANDGGVSTGRSRLANPSDGHVDEAITLRNTFGADLVSFVIDEEPLYALGVASINGPWSCMNASTLAGVGQHEWGHNLGCGHNDSGAGQSTLKGVYSYSYAHYFSYGGETRGTIMSYIGKRFSRFSNPNVSWNGNVTGTAARNHALTIENRKGAIGGWKTASAIDLDLDGILDVDEPDADSDGDGLPDLIDDVFNEVVLPFFGFSTDGDFEGWTSVNVSGPAVSNGWISGTASSNDPQLPNTGLGFPGSAGTTVLARMQASGNSTVQLFWGTSEANNFAGTRVVGVPYNANGDPQILSFDFSSKTEWTEKNITRFRFDPIGGTSASGKSFAVDWVAVTDGDADDDGLPDATDGYGDADEDGFPDFVDAESDGDNMADAVEVANGRNHTDAGDLAAHFETDGDFEGWNVSPHNIIGLEVADGSVRGTAVTGDPYFENHSFGFLGAQVPKISLRIKATANATTQLYWIPQGGAWNHLDRSYTGNGDWQVLEFDMTGNGQWDGQRIIWLRVDPIASAGADFEVDWIRGINGDADNDGFSDMDENIAGTDRLDPAEDAFLISESGVPVQVDGKAGRIYSLQWSESLVPASWGMVETAGPLATDLPVTFTSGTPSTNGFYRVLVEFP